ncbi:hypothetical protein [Leptospira kirschneri]|uniref:hypothetical protein n=1 Tax=Leptospira kirschneri TaxID=29507 RepID=UPI000377BF29|nr:hypothetical protein [Leptospira kirschneri]KON75667.1 putative lipoprotein [Leptospira kirschneri serovar Mozdok]KPZ78184.1 hypothetical protein APS47_07015 [Leptospira kirschneri serovar Mozdok]NDK05671.1 putative lipoprotein [Leptospira kirschneri serovar Mozdok]
MNKILCFATILILTVGCFTIGKVGYIVPAPNDKRGLLGEILGENCAFIVTNILNDMNHDLVSKGKSDLTNVGVEFKNSNCAQTRNLK